MARTPGAKTDSRGECLAEVKIRGKVSETRAMKVIAQREIGTSAWTRTLRELSAGRADQGGRSHVYLRALRRTASRYHRNHPVHP